MRRMPRWQLVPVPRELRTTLHAPLASALGDLSAITPLHILRQPGAEKLPCDVQKHLLVAFVLDYVQAGGCFPFRPLIDDKRKQDCALAPLSWRRAAPTSQVLMSLMLFIIVVSLILRAPRSCRSGLRNAKNCNLDFSMCLLQKKETISIRRFVREYESSGFVTRS